jgi:subtilase family serine protease
MESRIPTKALRYRTKLENGLLNSMKNGNKTPRPRHSLATAALFAAIAAAPAAAATLPVQSDIKPNLPGATPAGRTDAGHRLNLAIILPSRDPAGAAAFAAQVSTPRTKLFRHYLTPAQYAAKFGANPADYRAIAAWAKAHGLTPGEESAAHNVLPLTGTAAAVQAAFAVQLQNFKDRTGRIYYSAATQPVLPAELAGRVSAVLGLSSANHFAPLLRRAAPGAARNTGANHHPGFTAADLRSLYNIPALQPHSRTETVALFEQGGFDPNDVQTYETANNLPAIHAHFRSVDGYGGGVNNPDIEAEAVLDIDMVAALNPAVKSILVYEDGSDTFGVAMVDALTAMANDNAAQTVSISYGVDEAQQDPATMQAENTVLTQMVAQGQGVYVSSGDDGAYGREGAGLNAPDPGSQPNVTSVGGTTLFTRAPGVYGAEETWNDLGIFYGATGGGVSAVWPIPAWQVQNGTPVAVRNGGSATNRNVPDISAVGDPLTGVQVYSAINGGWGVLGGTSVSAPIWAGYASVMNAASKTIGFGAIGFINPTLYQLGNYNLFNDIADGSNGNTNIFGIPGFDAGYQYDNTTGFGSPLGSFLETTFVLWPTNAQTNPPPPVNGLQGKVAPTSVAVQWTAIPGASGYLVQNTSLATFALVNNAFTSSTSMVLKGLTPGQKYAVQLVTITPGGTTYSQPLYITTPSK